MKRSLLFTVTFASFFVALLVVKAADVIDSSGNPNRTLQDTKIAPASLEAGKAIYNGKGNCKTCHQETGLGVPGVFPPLAKSDFLLADKKRAIQQTMYGSKTKIKVNGVEYPGGIMTTVKLTDQEVVDVVNYILNSWGNNGGVVTLNDVKALRK